MRQDVPRLEMLRVRGHLKGKVLGEFVATIAHMQAGEEYLAATIAGPVHTGLGEFVRHRWWSHTGIAFHAAPGRRHVPGILQRHGVASFLFPVPGEEVLVELTEALLGEQGDVLIRGHFHGAVVHAFHAAGAGEGIDDHVLDPAAVGHSQADGQHELLTFETHLDGPQEVVSARLHALQVDLHHEELHAAADVRIQHFMRALRDLVSIVQQPILQAVAFLGTQDQDVVLPHGVTRLDRHAIVLGLLLPQAGSFCVVRGCRHVHDLLSFRILPSLAGVLVPVFHQARRTVRVQRTEHTALHDPDIALLQHGGYGHHHGEVRHAPVEVIAHGDDRALSVADQDDLAAIVKERGVRAGHIEPAEGGSAAGREQRGEGEQVMRSHGSLQFVL